MPAIETMDVINPATEEIVAKAPRASVAQVNAAVAAAKAAFPAWSKKPLAERRALLHKVADVIDAHAEEIGRILTQEQGKALMFAIGETRNMANDIRKLSSLELPVKVLEDSPQRRVEQHRRPLGVVAAIIPWNFPIALLGTKLPTALAAGNTIVVKPAATDAARDAAHR